MVSFVFAPTSTWARVWVNAESRCLRGAVRRADPFSALPSTAMTGRRPNADAVRAGSVAARCRPARQAPTARSRASPSTATSTRPIVAGAGVRRHLSGWRRIPMTVSSVSEARSPHSASSSMLFAPETTAQAHTARSPSASTTGPAANADRAPSRSRGVDQQPGRHPADPASPARQGQARYGSRHGPPHDHWASDITMITKPVPALLCTPTGRYPTSHTTPELATALLSRLAHPASPQARYQQAIRLHLSGEEGCAVVRRQGEGDLLAGRVPAARSPAAPVEFAGAGMDHLLPARGVPRCLPLPARCCVAPGIRVDGAQAPPGHMEGTPPTILRWWLVASWGWRDSVGPGEGADIPLPVPRGSDPDPPAELSMRKTARPGGTCGEPVAQQWCAVSLGAGSPPQGAEVRKEVTSGPPA